MTDLNFHSWELIGYASSVSAGSYFLWRKDGAFQVTKDRRAPVDTGGGYGSLESLLRLKGFRSDEINAISDSIDHSFISAGMMNR